LWSAPHGRARRVEAIDHTGLYDYVEFVGEYGPFDLLDLDNVARAPLLVPVPATRHNLPDSNTGYFAFFFRASSSVN